MVVKYRHFEMRQSEKYTDEMATGYILAHAPLYHWNFSDYLLYKQFDNDVEHLKNDQGDHCYFNPCLRRLINSREITILACPC